MSAIPCCLNPRISCPTRFFCWHTNLNRRTDAPAARRNGCAAPRTHIRITRVITAANGWCRLLIADGNCPGSVGNLWNAGFAHVDVYMFPCAGQDGPTQFNDLVSNLNANGVQYGMIWFDIETNPSSGCGWADQGSNCNYIQGLVDACSSAGVSCGVYASEYMWSVIAGSGCTAGGNLPLWYAVSRVVLLVLPYPAAAPRPFFCSEGVRPPSSTRPAHSQRSLVIITPAII